MLLPYVELGSEVKMSGTSIEGVAQSEGRKQPTSAKPDQDASRMHVGGTAFETSHASCYAHCRCHLFVFIICQSEPA